MVPLLYILSLPFYGRVSTPVVELVEQFLNFYQNQAVFYVNVDISTSGDWTLNGWGSPHVREALFDVTKSTSNPNTQQRKDMDLPTVYDAWAKFMGDESQDGSKGGSKGLPNFGPLGAGSDFWGFFQLAGVASIDFWYQSRDSDYSGYQLYHSAYETVFSVKEIIDKGWHTNTAMCQIYTEIGRIFADYEVLPFRLGYYAERVEKDGGRFFADHAGDLERDFGLNMTHFSKVVSGLVGEIRATQSGIDRFIFANSVEADGEIVNQANPIHLRSINDMLMNFERLFLYKQDSLLG